MCAKTDKAFRIVRSFSFIVFVTYGTAAFAYDPLDCLNDIAKADAEIPIGLATRLCSGTWTPEPVKCYQKVSKIDQEIPRGIAIDLCAGAVSAEKLWIATIRQLLRDGRLTVVWQLHFVV